MKTLDKKTVIARVPPALVRKLDSSAKKAGRSRSAELCMRLQESLKKFPALADAEAGVA